MNVYNVLLNMESNYLIFEFNCCNHFDDFKIFMFFSNNSFDFRFISNLVFIEFVNSLNQFRSFTQNSNQFKKSTLKKTLNFKSNNFLIFSFNVVMKKSTSFKLLNILKISMNIVMIDVAVFYKLNFQKKKNNRRKILFHDDVRNQ